MRIWIDLANSPHVPFFRALIPQFEERGHTVEVTARDFAQTVELAENAGMDAVVIGKHGGRTLGGKARNLAGRIAALGNWARRRKFDLAVSHNSYSHVLAGRMLGIRSVTLMDYEHQPANHIAFRFASRIIVPKAFPAGALRRFGARGSKVRRYDGIKEDVYLASFQPDPSFPAVLKELGVETTKLLVVVRPPARDALYHRFDNELFDELLGRLASREDVKVILLPRTESQRRSYIESANLIVPSTALDGANLIAAADLVVSAGGTMNREAAALGVPAVTIYAGEWAAIDEALVQDGRLIRIRDREDLANLRVSRKPGSDARRNLHVRGEVAGLILDAI